METIGEVLKEAIEVGVNKGDNTRGISGGCNK